MDNKEDSIFSFEGSSTDKSSEFSVSAEAERLQSLDTEALAESKINNSEPGKVKPMAEKLNRIMGNKLLLAGGGFLVLVLSGFVYVNFIYTPPSYNQVAQQTPPQPQPMYGAEQNGAGDQPSNSTESSVPGFSLDGETTVSPDMQAMEPVAEEWSPPGMAITDTPPNVQDTPKTELAQSMSSGTQPETASQPPASPAVMSAPESPEGSGVAASYQPPSASDPVDVAALREQLIDKDKKIASLASQLKQSERRYQVLASKSKKLLAKEKEMMAFYSEKTGEGPKGKDLARPTSASSYRIRAITEGLAWVDSGSGQTYTVRIGDSLPDIGNIIFIDADKMSIKGSRGEIK